MPVITSHGAAREVTGSCHLLELGGRHWLLDCGMHQGGDAVTRLRKERFAFDARRIDGVILSHAHLDHSGLLPKLVRQGFGGPIYCTGPTRNLLAIMLEDAAGIYFRDLEHTNLRNRRAGKKELPPLYDMEDVHRALQLCEPLALHANERLADDLTLHFHDAGHILGSALVELRCREGGRETTLVFSGDIGNAESALTRAPEIPERADLVLMEATYGNRPHRPLLDTLTELERVLADARQAGGTVLMPAFAVGRTQELLYHLGCFWQLGKLEGWRVFLDSPMAIAVTQLQNEWLDQIDEGEQQTLEHFGARSLEQFLPVLTLTPSPEESMALNRLQDGAIIIAGAGMCNGGRIRHHPREALIDSPPLWPPGCVRIKARFRRRSGATSRRRNAEAGAPWRPRRARVCGRMDCVAPLGKATSLPCATRLAPAPAVARRAGANRSALPWHRIWQERTHIVFAGFQARGTLGRQLVDGERYVRMFGERFAVRAQVHTLGGFSAHAGRDELLAWAGAIAGDPAFRLVHGESEGLEALAAALAAEGRTVSIAEPGEAHAF